MSRAGDMTAIKAAMMPQIDAALTLWLENLSALMQKASVEEVDRCIHIVKICRTPKRGAAWNEAIDFVTNALEEWKVESAGQNGSPAPGGSDGT